MHTDGKFADECFTRVEIWNRKIHEIYLSLYTIILLRTKRSPQSTLIIYDIIIYVMKLYYYNS